MRVETELISLYRDTFGEEPYAIEPLRRSGSYRQYYRLLGREGSVIGTYNPISEENVAFLYMTEHFLSKGLNVPKIFAQDIEKNIYLQQDLSDMTLLRYLTEAKPDKIAVYKRILEHLYKFQKIGAEDFDWDKCYPVTYYGREAFLYDLNYFKYMVLRIKRVNFHELKLERDFERLVNILLATKSEYFVYRDFQSRNIMFYGDDFYFIDYQGGRRGSVFYDLVSILFDTNVKFTQEQRGELFKYYFNLVSGELGITYEEYWRLVMFYALVRKLQAVAAYVFRGEVEKKWHFLINLPKAVGGLAEVMDMFDFSSELPELSRAIKELIGIYEAYPKKVDLEVEINSFSFGYRGYPPDKAGHHGLVVDCRALPNPGRLNDFKYKTGLDSDVQNWLFGLEVVEEFLGKVLDIVFHMIEGYVAKGYERLQINFGCTGGRHRSVFCAEQIYQALRSFYDFRAIQVNHLERENWEAVKSEAYSSAISGKEA